MSAPHYCDQSRQACATPYTCGAACRLETRNSDGSDAGITMVPNWRDRLIGFFATSKPVEFCKVYALYRRHHSMAYAARRAYIIAIRGLPF